MAYYEPTQWNVKDPITQQRMNHIEQGILAASQLQDNIASVEVIARAANTLANSHVQPLADLRTDVDHLLSQSESETDYGAEALTQIINATTNHSPAYDNLNARYGAIEENAETIRALTQANSDAIENAKRSGVLNDTLKKRFEAVESNISTLVNGYNSLHDDLVSAGGTDAQGQEQSLVTRLRNIDNNQKPSRTLISVIAELETAHGTNDMYASITERFKATEDEIAAAHESTALGRTVATNNAFNSLDARFEAIETEIVNARGGLTDVDTRLDNIEGNTSSLSSGKIDKTSIANNLTTTAEGFVLDARQGKTLNDAKINYTDVVNDLTHTDADKPLSANQGKVLKDALDAIDTAYKAADSALDTRVDDIEDELEAARVNDGTLDDRFDAVEERTSTLETKVTNIANELSMTNIADQVVNTTSRIDTIEENIVAIGKEIGMLQDEASVVDLSTAVSRTDTRVDSLESRLDAVDGQAGTVAGLASRMSTAESDIDALETELNTATTGVKARITALETTVDTTTTGLSDRMSAAENAISHTAEGNDPGGLTERMTTAETTLAGKANSSDMTTALAEKANVTDVNTALGNKANATEVSLTIVKAKNEVAYTEGVPNAQQTWPIVDRNDYLLQSTADNKYYYWKHIGNEWHLMGGAGNGGGGNTSGYDLTRAAYNAIETKTENTDYYVIDTIEDGENEYHNEYHHYRWIPGDNNTLVEIEIGNYVRRYNMNKTYDETEQKYYLNLYEYGYDEAFDDTTANRVAYIELPQGGGGGGGSAAVTRVIRVTPSTITTVLCEEKIYLRFFYSCVDTTGEAHEGAYVLKYNNGSVIASEERLVSGASDTVVSTGVWPADPRPIGYYQIDITNYCRLGTQTFNLAVTADGTTINRTWTVNIIELRLTSNAPESNLIATGESFLFPYTPFGALTKTLYVQIDNNAPTTVNLGAATSGNELEYNIPAQAHGAHTISMYLKANIDGTDKTSDTITRDYIWYDINSNVKPIIIASPYRGTAVSTVSTWSEWVSGTTYHIGDKVKITNGNSVVGYVCKTENSDATFNPDKWIAQVINAQQYSEIEIPYTVYNKNSSNFTVEYYYDYVPDADNSARLVGSVTLNNTNTGTLSYEMADFGAHTLTIKVGEVYETFNVNAAEMDIDISLVPGTVIDFNPAILTNNSINRTPSWTYNGQTYNMTVSDNFNWSDDASGGGYKEDEDGKCFVVKAGTWAKFNYKMFKQNVDNTDPENPIFTSSAFDRGAEMKVIFKVAAVRKADAVWFTNVGTPTENSDIDIGIQLSAHSGWLKTSGAANPDPNDPSDPYLALSYSEEDKIELDINVNRQGNNEDFIMAYEDGVPSKAYAYDTTEILYQWPGHEQDIVIGSPDCDIHIYRFRIYDKGLSTSEILRNFIGDGGTITEKVARYDRNSIYYDSTKENPRLRYTPYSSASAILDPEQLAKRMPDVKILMLECPTFTKSKKTFVKSSLRCIHAIGGTAYPSRGDEDNWLFMDGYHSGQGTTSDNYGQSSRNVDFLFMSDGVNAPTKKKNISGYEGYVSKLIKGENNSVYNPTSKSWEAAVGATATVCVDWKDGDNWKASKDYVTNDLVRHNGEVYKCLLNHTSGAEWEADKWQIQPNYTNKVSLTSTSIPNNYFNLKVNVASSENVNNALLQKRYNDFVKYVYQSPAYKRDNRIKNDMEFVPAVLFIRETDPTVDDNGHYINHLEFDDTNWHFYSLGNIGDSKKTDYTRAYDPTDMNEFTVEISDNNTHNSQFQSGVYINNGQRIIEESESGINSMNYVWDIDAETEWNAQRDPTEFELDHDYRVANNIKKYADGTDVQDEFPYILPNGKVYVNYRHRMLSAEPFDGKHSFEFRYACCGDYRDGDLINETPGQDDDAQFDINRAVIEAFYEWIITASNAEFKSELAEWVVPEAVEFYYAYTHFYTMMDNRAKNCFWHFGKTGTHRQVHHAYKELLHVYDELIGGEYVRTSDVELDPNKTYYTEYAFDLWVYDTDTAIGIDNNGKLIFSYGKEDTDYRVPNNPVSGYVFNGAGSIIWRRLSTSFTDEIADIFNVVNEQACFDASNLINEFDKFQNCYPEEMWRLDIQRKYIRTFTGRSYDNSKLTDSDGNTKQNTRFLKEMMQGRKKYQRRQWVRDQSIYFGSKYMLNNVRNNTIEMVCYTPDAAFWDSQGYAIKDDKGDVIGYRPFTTDDFVFYADPSVPNSPNKLYKCVVAHDGGPFDSTKWVEGVTPDYHLKIIPYQDMYINVAVGNGGLRTPTRAVAGQEYTIDCTANMNETRIYIYAGSYIQALSNLAPMYIGANIFSTAARLKKLDLGTDNETYKNSNLTTLTILPNMPILEELNIKNCGGLTGTINLGESNNLRKIEAYGTAITNVTLPDYTKIETLHLPSTINTLNLKSARQLTDFNMINKATGLEDYSGLIGINIADSDYSANINWLDIGAACLNSVATMYLTGLTTSTLNNISDLEAFVNRKKALETTYDIQGNLINKLNLTGTVTVEGDWSLIEKTSYQNTWPNLTLNVDPEHEVIRYKVTYYRTVADMNAGQELYSLYLTPAPGSSTVSLGNDPVYTNVIAMPTKTSSVSTEYIFGERNAYGYITWTGWRKSTSVYPVRNDTNIQGDTNLIAVFNEHTRSYPIHWYLHEGDSTPVRISEAVEYGQSYDGLEPTMYNLKEANQATTSIRISGSNCTYSIFNGWQRSPVNLDETFLNSNQTAYCIYGDWQGETNIPVDTILADVTLTPRKLLLLSVYNDNGDLGNDLIEVGDTLDLTLGYDSKETGVLLIGEGATYVMNDSRTYNPTVSFSTVGNPPAFSSNIMPFTSDDGFTLAIDYRFDTAAIGTSSNYAILAGCYEKIDANTVQGFSLYYDTNEQEKTVKVCFGDQSTSETFATNQSHNCVISDSTNADMRNIIVLRHPAGSNVIKVYSGISSTTNILSSLDNAFFEKEIQWSANTSTAKLCFGHLLPSGSAIPLSNYLSGGLGTIYWAKYWNKDLGKSECIKLASWPHEKIRFAVEEYPTADKQIITTNSKNIFFNALQVSQYGGPTIVHNARGSNSNEIVSWADSVYRDIGNKRFLLGLPITIQSLINKTELHASAVKQEQGQFNQKYTYFTNYDTTDYVFLPAYPEVSGNTNGNMYAGEAYQGMPWLSGGNTKVISYVNTSYNFNNPSQVSAYMNLRFPSIPIKLGESANTVYIGYNGTDSVYNKIGAARIQRGDILIHNQIAYIYADDNDVRNGAPIINASSGAFQCTAGGWVQGRSWWTRSVMEMDPATSYNSFYYINENTVTTDNNGVSRTYPTDGERNGCWFVYSFGI